MVNPTANSLLAAYAAEAQDDFELDVTRAFSPQREQPSRTRWATEARYSRKRSAGAPRGPRRRLRKA